MKYLLCVFQNGVKPSSSHHNSSSSGKPEDPDTDSACSGDSGRGPSEEGENGKSQMYFTLLYSCRRLSEEGEGGGNGKSQII